MAVCMLSLYLKLGMSLALIDRFCFAFFLVCLAYIDIDTFTLPWVLLLSLIISGLAFSLIYFYFPHLYVPLAKQFGLLKYLVFSESLRFSASDRALGASMGFLSSPL